MNELSAKCPIKLLEHQIEHVKKIWHAYVKDKIFSCVDSSTTGLGKSHTTLYIAWMLQKMYGLKVMIVAPNDTSLHSADSWLHHAKVYGIEIMYATTYSSLRGGRGTVSHDWLIPDPENKKKWTASREFEKICTRGVFLIFDEFHHTKNSSMSHYACAALVKMAKKYRSICRVALISHTPGDKNEHCVQLLRMAGIMTHTKVLKHIPFTHDYEWENYGLGELVRVCKKLSPQNAPRIDAMLYRLSKAKSLIICKELYQEFLRPEITFAMPTPKKEHKVTLVNAFLETDEDSLQVLQDGLAMLSGAVQWNNGQVGAANQWSLANIGNGLQMIEQGKLSCIANYVNREVEKNKNKKFVISCGARGIENHELLRNMIYRKTTPDEYENIINELRRKNPEWSRVPKDVIKYVIMPLLSEKKKPHVLNGSVGKEKRIEIIRKFQEDSRDSWCLILTPGLGSESISLHDKHGKHPREMLIIPSFYFSQTVQSSGRVNRVGMKSEAKVMMVYCKAAALETSILHSMIRKTHVARDLIAEKQDVMYPGEYPFVIHGQRDEALEQSLNLLRQMV